MVSKNIELENKLLQQFPLSGILRDIFSFSAVIFFMCCSLLMLPVLTKAQVTVKNEKSTDTTSILQLIRKGDGLVNTKPEEALQFFSAALQQSKQAGYSKGIALASAKTGRWFFGNNIDKAIELANQALRIYEKENIGSIEDKAEVHLLLAEAYDEQGRKDSSAYFYYLLSREIETGNINDPALAIDVFTKLTIFWVNMDYGNIDLAEYNKTVGRYVEKAKIAAKQIKDSADAASSIYFLQGAYFHGRREYDSARYYYFQYIEDRERRKKLFMLRKISTLTNIADTYLQQNRPDEALIYIEQAKAIGDGPQKSNFLAFFMTFIDLIKAKAFYQQKKYLPAISLINESLAKLKTTGGHLRDEVVDAYKISAESYEAIGDYKKALEQKGIYIQLHDSLMKKDKVDMVNRLEIRYRISEKDKELAEQKLMIAEVGNTVRKRNFLIAGISLLALFGGLIFTLWRRKNIHKQKLQQERIDNLQQKMEIERLNATIDGEEKERTRISRELHDGIGGLLKAAKMNFELARKNNNYEHNVDFSDGIKLLEETSAGLRETAHNIMPEILLQEGLVRAVKSFCERMTGKGGTTISFQTLGNETAINTTFDLPVYRIVQELIHNIRKHAKASTALVQMNFHEDGGLDITVEDDGIGMPEDAIKKANGMGLKNITERTRQLGGKLDIKSFPGKGTSVYLDFESQQKIV